MKKRITAIIISAVTSVMMAQSAMAATPEATAKAQQIVATIITPGMTDVQKVQACNEYIRQNVNYDDTQQYFTADAALIYGTATCQGYSEAFKLLMDLSGVPCEVVANYELNHAWNRVIIAGVPYDVDTTWNDSTYTNDFTLLTVDQMANKQAQMAANGFMYEDDSPTTEADFEAFCNNLKSAKVYKHVTKDVIKEMFK